MSSSFNVHPVDTIEIDIVQSPTPAKQRARNIHTSLDHEFPKVDEKEYHQAEDTKFSSSAVLKICALHPNTSFHVLSPQHDHAGPPLHQSSSNPRM